MVTDPTRHNLSLTRLKVCDLWLTMRSQFYVCSRPEPKEDIKLVHTFVAKPQRDIDTTILLSCLFVLEFNAILRDKVKSW